MERGHYNGYRGRSGVQKVLLGLVSVLAVLVVLMALVLLLGQSYIYYGADGVHLDLPFLKRQPTPPPDVDQVVVEILPPAPKEPDQSEQSDLSEPMVGDEVESMPAEQESNEPVE